MDEYVERISDHRPVLVRISLAPTTAAAVGTADTDIDALIADLLQDTDRAADAARPRRGRSRGRAGAAGGYAKS